MFPSAGPLCLVTVASLVLATSDAYACVWDTDTLREESLGQEDVLEVVSGLLGKRGQEFYRLKVEYTRRLVASGDATKERYDDLAVALEKLGQRDEALAVLDEKERRFPGEYRTLANRGTILVHKGNLAEGLAYLKRAVAVNPAAHFGREKFQIALIEWRLADQRGEGDSCGNVTGLSSDGPAPDGIFPLAWTVDKSDLPGDVRARVDEVIPAMVGLIRFGSAEESPVVWYNLGLALGWRGDKNLALRALRRAERLGHTCAKELAVNLGQEMYPRPDRTPEALDAAWTKAQERDARRRRDEEALARFAPAKAFGY